MVYYLQGNHKEIFFATGILASLLFTIFKGEELTRISRLIGLPVPDNIAHSENLELSVKV